MKQNILDIGKELNKEEQKTINGGGPSLECFRRPVGTPCGYDGGVCQYPAPYIPYKVCL